MKPVSESKTASAVCFSICPALEIRNEVLVLENEHYTVAFMLTYHLNLLELKETENNHKMVNFSE